MLFDQMQRRDFLFVAGSVALSFDLQAQPANLPTIGILGAGRLGALAPLMRTFREGLEEQGLVEGRNVGIIQELAQGDVAELDGLAENLVRKGVKAIVASGGLVSARAAMKATSTTPVLFLAGYDPVELGLVKSLNRPGGNATGVSLFSTELVQKRIAYLLELGSRIRTVGILVDPKSITPQIELQAAVDAAAAKSHEVRFFEASTAGEIDAAFTSAAEQQVSALLVTAAPTFSRLRNQIVGLAARYRIPVMYPWREYVDAGGLMSYGTELTWGYRLIGQYAARILKGEKPSELPVQQPTRFNLVINLKTAKALGLDLANTAPLLLAIVDEVIE
jgi:putative ABC transport system substrate-binding protein